MPQDHPHLTEHTLRPAVTDRDGGILACMHTHLPGNYSWTREPVGFCRLRVEPSCHVRGSCPMQPTRILLLPWPATSKPCVCSRLTSRTAGGRMPRIDETLYCVLSTACRFGMSRGAELLRIEARLSPQQPDCQTPPWMSCARGDKAVGSHILSPSFYDSHDSHECGYLHVLLWHAVPHTK